MLVAPEPNAARDRLLDLARLCRRTGSFSLDAGITREYYRLIGEFGSARGRLPEHDIRILRRAVSEIDDLDPYHREFMRDALGETRLAILKRWVRTGCALNSGEVDAVMRALRLAAPLCRAMAGVGPDTEDSPAPVSGERATDAVPAPVSMDDISKLLMDTANRDGILRPTERPDVFSVATGTGEALRLTTSRDVFATGDGPGTRCEFATYGGSGFDGLLDLLPAPDDLPDWMRRVEVNVSDGDVTLTRVAYVVSCMDGDRTILSSRALNGAIVNPYGTPSKPFVASLERYLRQAGKSELARIRLAVMMERANLGAARRQRAFALEIAAALARHVTTEGGADIRADLEAVAGRQSPVLVTLERARSIRHSPNLFDIARGVPDDGGICLDIPPALLRASASEISTIARERGAGVDPDSLCHEVDRLLEPVDL